MINVTHKISTLVKRVTTPVIVFTHFHLALDKNVDAGQ